MKKIFSAKWKGSKLPRKQRKYKAKAPLHIRHKMMSTNLKKDLKKKYGKKNIPLRKDDNVKVMRGEFKGKTGKIDSVNLRRLRVTIAGINRTKRDGTKVGVYFNPSNLQIQELQIDDKKRVKSIERKSPLKKEKTEKKEEKPKENKNAPKKK